MVRVLPKELMQEAAARIWALAQEPSARCYPLFQDEADVTRTLRWALEEETGHARAYWKDGAPAGVCCFHAESERAYAQIVALYAWDDFAAAADALLRSVDAACPGYTIDAGQAGDNVRLGTALQRRGYRITDDCLDLRRALPVLTEANESGEDLVLLEDAEDEGFEEYAPFHDAWFPGLYWDLACLKQYPGDWAVIAARRGDQFAGAVLLIWGPNLAEIYGLHAAEGAMANALLTAALSHASRPDMGCREMLYMADAADETCVAAARECGFVRFGRYVGWRKQPRQPRRAAT